MFNIKLKLIFKFLTTLSKIRQKIIIYKKNL